MEQANRGGSNLSVLQEMTTKPGDSVFCRGVDRNSDTLAISISLKWPLNPIFDKLSVKNKIVLRMLNSGIKSR